MEAYGCGLASLYLAVFNIMYKCKYYSVVCACNAMYLYLCAYLLCVIVHVYTCNLWTTTTLRLQV